MVDSTAADSTGWRRTTNLLAASFCSDFGGTSASISFPLVTTTLPWTRRTALRTAATWPERA